MLEWQLHKTSSFKRGEPKRTDTRKARHLLVPPHVKFNVRENVAWQASLLEYDLVSCPSSSFVLDHCSIWMRQELQAPKNPLGLMSSMTLPFQEPIQMSRRSTLKVTFLYCARLGCRCEEHIFDVMEH